MVHQSGSSGGGCLGTWCGAAGAAISRTHNVLEFAGEIVFEQK